MTRNVVRFLCLHASISPAIFGYAVGSPVSDIATFLGFCASFHFFISVPSNPLNPTIRDLCADMAFSIMSSGSSHEESRVVPSVLSVAAPVRAPGNRRCHLKAQMAFYTVKLLLVAYALIAHALFKPCAKLYSRMPKHNLISLLFKKHPLVNINFRHSRLL